MPGHRGLLAQARAKKSAKVFRGLAPLLYRRPAAKRSRSATELRLVGREELGNRPSGHRIRWVSVHPMLGNIQPDRLFFEADSNAQGNFQEPEYDE